MDLIKRIVKQAFFIIIPLTLLSVIMAWKIESFRFIKLFGNPALMPISIILGGILGLANIKGLAWGIEGLLGAKKANMRIILLNLFRFIILLIIILLLAVLKLVNFIGLLIGLTVIFVIIIKEGLKMAMSQSKK